MSLKVLIVPDKFKGTLTAQAAAEAIASGWRAAREGDSLELLPMTDGGDGFGDVMGQLLKAELQTTGTVDAAHRPCLAQWWWEAKTKTAIVESARVIGLARLPPKKFHPFQLDTFGLGALFKAAAQKGARRCLVGIGGSATNDGGFGVARSLGWEFRGWSGSAITDWTRLNSIVSLHPPPRVRYFEELLVAVDVQNPLLGARGCTRIYGPQKGLRAEDFSRTELCLKKLERNVAKELNRECASKPGAGAAGGLGFGLCCFLGARLQPGFEMFASYAGLARRLASSHLVITGEGAIDQQSLMGKGVGEIAYRCRKLKIPCIAIAGTIAVAGEMKSPFTLMRGLTELTTVERAKAKPAFWLERAAKQIAKEWKTIGAPID